MKVWVHGLALALVLVGLPPSVSTAGAQTFAQATTPSPKPVRTPKPTETPAPPKIQRSEVITAGNWTVTCAEPDQGGAKPRCSAVLKIAQDQNNVQRVVFTWLIGLRDGKLLSLMSIPPGVLIAPGIVVKVGAGEPRKFNYTLCQPDHCEATVPLEDALVKELTASPTAEVSAVAVNGATAKFNVNLAGFEQALAEIVR